MDIEHRKEFLIKSLDLSKEYRNVIAHGSKTIGLNGLPVLPKEQSIRLAGKLLSREEYNSKLGQNDIYSVFIIILTLTNDTTLLMAFYMDCHVFFINIRITLLTTKQYSRFLEYQTIYCKELKHFYVIDFLYD